MIEIWKTIEGYNGMYEVSSLGRVKSVQKWRGSSFRILGDRPSRKGYNTASLYKNKKSKTFSVHQLVAVAFLGHEIDGMKNQVDHIDGNKKNNCVDNLQILSAEAHIIKTYSQKPSSSKYIGVSWDGKNKKWRASITKNNINYNLGRFDNELDAHKARVNAE
jgi:hypothetical protein